MTQIASAFIGLSPQISRGVTDNVRRQMGPVGVGAGRQFSDDFSRESNRRIGGVGKKLGSGFGRAFAAAGGAIAAVGITDFLTEAVGSASDLEEAGTKLNAIFGKDGSAAVQTFAAAGAKALGQTKLEVLDAAANFGIFGKAAGLGGTDLAKFSTGFASLSTDLASFYNADPTTAVEAIGAALRGESEPIRQFGVLLDDATLKNEAMALGLISTTKDALTPQQKVLAAQAAIYKQTQDAQGDFARTSGGLANQQRILSATFKDARAQLGSKLLPVVTRAVTFLNDRALPAFEGIKAAIGDRLQPVLDNLGPAFEEVSDLVRQNPTFVKAFAVALGVLVGAIAAVTLATTAFSIALNTTGIPLLIIGLAAAAAALYVAYRRSDEFQEVVQRIGDAVRAFAADLVPKVRALADSFVKDGLPAIRAFGEYVVAKVVPVILDLVEVFATKVIPILKSVASFIITKVVPAVGRLIVDVGEKLRPVFDQLVETFVAKVLPTISKLLDKVQEYGPAIGKIIGFLGRWIGTLLRLAATVLGKVLPPVIRFVGFVISKLVPAIANVIGVVLKVVAKVAEFGSSLLQAAGNAQAFATKVGRVVTLVVDKVVNGIGGLPDKILGFVGDMVSAGSAFIGGLFDGIRSAASGAGGLLADIASSVGEAFRGVINDLIDGLNSAIPNKIGAGKLSIDLPDSPIPYLAKGTSFFRGGSAIVGENGPELVNLPRGSQVKTAAQTRRLARAVDLGEPVVAASSGGGAVMPETVVLQVGDRSFVAYLKQIAGDVVDSAADLTGERIGAAW